MKKIYLIFVTLLLAGCTSYGIPKDNFLAGKEPAHFPSNICVGIKVNVISAEKEWEKKELQKLKEDIALDLNKIPNVRYLGSDTETTQKVYVLTLNRTPYSLNEPYIMVFTLGVIPQPFSSYVGYVFELSNSEQVSLGKVDVTHVQNDWMGWLAPLISLLPGQTLNKEEAISRNHIRIQKDMQASFAKLGVFDGCK